MADDQKIYRASTTAPVNIAVIKYWGKRDPTLNLPTNSSLSVTLSQADLRTHTTAACSASFPGPDSLVINGAPQDISGPRTQACLRLLREQRAALESSSSPAPLPSLSSFPLRIASVNNFPTAAGLASSAAGFAALVRAVADLYQLPASPAELSRIARQGSGSACRSLFGGYVAWERGGEGAAGGAEAGAGAGTGAGAEGAQARADDGSDSLATQVAPAGHWPDMRALILVVSADKKGVSSTAGMQATVATSELFATRAATLVPRRMAQMRAAILARDFDAFARLTMRDSNNFHATCLDTEPPIFYLNDVSRAAIRVVEDINKAVGRIVAAYTFDAGPNAVVYYLAENESLVAGTFKADMGSAAGWDTERGRAVQINGGAAIDRKSMSLVVKGVDRVILTGVGEGPISVTEHLIDENGKVVESET
ncbi:diphosphomevalonate decarboxylase [Lineolata rhizophorae]|uniref:Diphosphomevalonate decarboxylase n=1 Tax=Lineolata rhizophorae TaxID=578093 RepID=A0A6A6PBY6_9PEZI|nr:diphosphomevalonate decarboxylase [Lineolata rhizophorae]